jgi:hypothetical protein
VKRDPIISPLFKPTLILLIALAIGAQVVARQEGKPERHESYPGQSRHAQPPDGWYCSVTANDEHHCECHRVPADGELCQEAEPDVQECKVWCWAHSTPKYGPDGRVVGMESSHCLCPIVCRDGPSNAKGETK